MWRGEKVAEITSIGVRHTASESTHTLNREQEGKGHTQIHSHTPTNVRLQNERHTRSSEMRAESENSTKTCLRWHTCAALMSSRRTE